MSNLYTITPPVAGSVPKNNCGYGIMHPFCGSGVDAFGSVRGTASEKRPPVHHYVAPGALTIFYKTWGNHSLSDAKRFYD